MTVTRQGPCAARLLQLQRDLCAMEGAFLLGSFSLCFQLECAVQLLPVCAVAQQGWGVCSRSVPAPIPCHNLDTKG